MYTESQYIKTDDHETSGWYGRYVYKVGNKTQITQIGPSTTRYEIEHQLNYGRSYFERIEAKQGDGQIAIKS